MDIFMKQGITNFPVIDLQREIQFSLEALRKRFVPSKVQQRPGAAVPWSMDNILLTGATGFIGNHLLVKLLEAFPNSRMYCLVRGTSQAHCLDRILESAKEFGTDAAISRALQRVTAIRGDIGKTRLGMSSSDYAMLTCSVDTVVNLAARDNFFLPYAVLRPAHVDAIFYLVDFCTQLKIKPLVHTSSCTGRLPESMLKAGMQGTRVLDNGMYNGYTQSKYVGFRMLEELALLRVTSDLVPPVCHITFGYVHGEHALHDPPKVPDISDAMEVWMKVSLMNKVAMNEEVPMDMAPMSYVTDCMVEILEDYCSGKRGTPMDSEKCKPELIEIYAHHSLMMSELRELLRAYLGEGVVRDVSMAEFSEIFTKTMAAVGTVPTKTLSKCVTPEWAAQCNIILSTPENLYRSPKYGPPPAFSKKYFLRLLQIIDVDMSLSGGKTA